MTSQNWAALSQELTDALSLSVPPIALTFSAAPIDGVSAFQEAMPQPTEDGRTGRVPAGCVFWMKAVDATFNTAPEDHYNCSVGSFTHGLKTLQEVAGNQDVAALMASGWVNEEAVSRIPYIT